MSQYISRKLAKCLLRNNLINSNEINDYSYYTQLLLEKVIGFFSVLLVALMNHLVLQTIFFLLFFSNIRKRSGGFHAKSFFECILLSFCVYWGYITFLFPYLLKTSWLNTCLLAVALIIILNIGAVNHPNMHWDNEEYIMCKNAARMICIIEVAIIIACSLIGIAYGYILFMSFGVILSAIMLLVAKFIRQEVIV